MARVGRFGRRRSSGQNLTMLISALLREQRQQEDRAAHDAWANGGQFKGEDMTDARYVGYLKGRRDMFSKDDPLYDQFNNEVIQTEFSIGEQKIGLAFKQGKVGAGAVASFYRSQLSKIPTESAFYREVAGRAAEWAKAASGAARGAGRARARKAVEEKITAQRGIIGNFDAITAGLEQIARQRGFISGRQTIFDVPTNNYVGLFDGLSITFEDWQAASRAAYAAYDAMVPAYEALGRSTSGLLDDKQKLFDNAITNLNSVDDRSKYETARKLWMDRVESAAGDPYLTQKYNDAYANSLRGIYAGAASAEGMELNDPNFAGAISNEYIALTTGKPSGPTPFDLIEGGESDAQETAARSAGLVEDLELLATGQAYFGQTDFGGPLQVVQYPVGAQLDPFGKNMLGDSVQQTVIKVNGESRVVSLKGAPIESGMLLAPDGSPMPLTAVNPAEIGELLKRGWTYEATGSTVGYVFEQPFSKDNLYGVYDAAGNMTFTSDNPFVTGTFLGEGGFVVIGDVAPGAGGKLTVNPLSTLKNPTQRFAPIPIDKSVNEADVDRLAGSSGLTPLGLTPEKAAEYDNYKRQPGTITAKMTLGIPGQRSAMQEAINGALEGARAGLMPYLTPQAAPSSPTIDRQASPWTWTTPKPPTAPTAPTISGELFGPPTPSTYTPPPPEPLTSTQTGDLLRFGLQSIDYAKATRTGSDGSGSTTLKTIR